MANTDFLTGGQMWADSYLTKISSYSEGDQPIFRTKDGINGQCTVRLTNSGDKVIEYNGSFYEIGKDGFPDKSKLVKKEDIKPLS